jgi:hypothetical protein
LTRSLSVVFGSVFVDVFQAATELIRELRTVNGRTGWATFFGRLSGGLGLGLLGAAVFKLNHGDSGIDLMNDSTSEASATDSE